MKEMMVTIKICILCSWRLSVAFEILSEILSTCNTDGRKERRTSHGSQDALREKLIDLPETQRSSKLSMQIFGCQVRSQQGRQKLVSVSNLNL